MLLIFMAGVVVGRLPCVNPLDGGAPPSLPLCANCTSYGSYAFDIRAYGAVLDGVTDNTAAVQAAVSAALATGGGGTVFIPGGLWRISGTVWINSTLPLQLARGGRAIDVVER